MCVLISSTTLSYTFLVLRRTLGNIHLHCPSCKVLVILVSFWSNLNFLDIFSKIISWKTVQWEPNCSTQTDKRVEEETGMTQPTVAYRNVVNALKKENNFWLRFVRPRPAGPTTSCVRMILLTDPRIFTRQTFTPVIKTRFIYLMERKKRPHCWRRVIIVLPLWFTRTRVHCFVDQHETSAQLLYLQHSTVFHFVCISNHITVLISI
jgi:hypothetical protein